jgi:DNA mismatch repair protein MutL
LLEPSCIERIAAGEVIERPASVVKELVENSLDAGATSIRVSIRRGGLEEIVVEDDGHGIPVRELPLAVERHATSKITGSGDLGSITTFGFRGEAVASIASVSRFSLRSRYFKDEIGGRLDLIGGQLDRREPIADVMLASSGGKMIRFNEVEVRPMGRNARGVIGMRIPADQRIISLIITGAERVRRFDGEAAGMRVEGVVSLPTYTRGNRTGQFFFVNRRAVFDKGLAHAISAAYRDVVPSGRFPLAVLFLDVPTPRVDVNVHPTKAEIRLRDEGAAHELVRHSIRAALDLHREPIEEVAGHEERTETMSAEERESRVLRELVENSTWGASDGHPRGPQWSRRREGPTLFGPSDMTPVGPPSSPEENESDIGAAPEPSDGGALWQVHNTFILTQIRGALVIVDQHNSHERILYDQGRQSLQGQPVPVQQLLFPATLELSPEELTAYEVHAHDLERVGLVTEPFGGSTILVRGIPSGLRNWNDGELLRDVLGDLADNRSESSDPRESILASMSCHGAIKAGEKLSPPEMQSLIDRLFATDQPYSCPHGRPTVIRIGLPELERRFGRR